MQLQLHSISLFQFKNYFEQQFKFEENIIGICGKNGVGKTNLLDAIHYLCFTKSYFTRQDTQVAKQGYQGFRVEGQFCLKGEEEMAVCILRENGRKEFLVNDISYNRFSSHIGRYPCVVIAPDDVQLIVGSSEERRRFVDTLISQMDAVYLQSLIKYTKLLQQRNSFLKAYNNGYGGQDISLLDVLDEQLIAEGNRIHRKRSDFLLAFLPVAKQLYNDIAQQYEPVELFYESELQQSTMEEIISRNRQKDLLLQRTSGGTHRDDLIFNLANQPFRNIASQGQRKSLLFALKLAEMEVLREQKKVSPLLLLDDVFEKLDEERISNLLIRVCTDNEGQVFITDTNCTRLQKQLEQSRLPFQSIKL